MQWYDPVKLFGIEIFQVNLDVSSLVFLYESGQRGTMLQNIVSRFSHNIVISLIHI